jgi:ABC-type Fe3+ transport system permease subunit
MATQIVGVPLHSVRPWWLQSLYALLLLSVVALVTLLVGEIYYAFEDAHTGQHDHGVWGPIFDLAWFVFVPTLLASLVAGLIALVVGWALHRASLTRYGIRAIGYCSFAIAVVVGVAVAQV